VKPGRHKESLQLILCAMFDKVTGKEGIQFPVVPSKFFPNDFFGNDLVSFNEQAFQAPHKRRLKKKKLNSFLKALKS
jgi:hypothetical protein